MNDLNALDQNYWFASASLFVQLAFLIAGVWFALNILKTLRAFQEQIGALLKLSITGAASDRSSTASATRPLADASPYWLAPSESAPPSAPRLEDRGPARVTVARRKMVLWLQAPMTTTQPAPWRRIVSWLQAPAGT
jgi:hypothetical protein